MPLELRIRKARERKQSIEQEEEERDYGVLWNTGMKCKGGKKNIRNGIREASGIYLN